jgi:Protein of unknown function (DUF3572)
MKIDPLNTANAQILSIKAVEFLALEEQRLNRFLALTGIAPQELSAQISNSAFLGGVLDYLLNDETLLFEFCEFADVSADHPRAARLKLP